MTQNHAEFEPIGHIIRIECSWLRCISVILVVSFSNASSLLPLRSQNPSRNICDNTAELSSEPLLEVQGVRDHLLLLSWGAPGVSSKQLLSEAENSIHASYLVCACLEKERPSPGRTPDLFLVGACKCSCLCRGVTAWSVSLHELSLPSPVAHAAGCKGRVMALRPHRRKELRVSAAVQPFVHLSLCSQVSKPG